MDKTINVREIHPAALYTIRDAATLLKVSRTTFYWLRQNGEIKTVRWLRRSVRVKGRELIRFLSRLQRNERNSACVT